MKTPNPKSEDSSTKSSLDSPGRSPGETALKRRESLFEEELTRKEGVLKALLNNIPDMAWLKDEDSRFIAVNEPFAALCGCTPEEVVGKTDLELWPRPLALNYRRDDRKV
ncbi:MAG: PAS domain-containing protein, partial [Lentisphaerota bacterium]